jgi:predicted phosphodiesterase
MKAILSDIHGNLEALQAVLEDMSRHDVEDIYCLGDVAAYGGPNPRECLDLVMAWNVVLLGNFDLALLQEREAFCDSAEQAMAWAEARVRAPVPDHQTADRRMQFLADRPRFRREGDYLYVHGSARNPLNEYVFPEDIYNPRKMERIFAAVQRYCFQGHTHIPGVFTDDLRFLDPDAMGHIYLLDHHKTLCNVGSVGQPRDGDWQACYILLDDNAIYFRRVEYDLETTIRKMHAIPYLATFLADRLRDGR